MNSEPRSVLQNVQALRGVAVVMVMLGHILVPTDFLWIEKALKGFHYFAYAGADIFFVLSGFIISTVVTKRSADGTMSGRFKRALIFLAKRFFRIYPVYWIVLGTSALAARWVTIESGMPQLQSWQVIMLLNRTNWLIPQAWTLVFEVYFYTAAFLILLLFPRKFYPVIFMLMLLQAAFSLLASQPDELMFTSALVLEFGFGCGVAWAISTGRRAPGGIVLCAGLICFLLGAWLTSRFGLLDSGLRTVSFGLGSAFILYVAVVSELTRAYLAGRFIQLIGDSSYSLYLWHKGMFVVLGAAFQDLLPHQLQVILTISVTTLFCLWFHKVVERPMLDSANAMLARRSRYPLNSSWGKDTVP